MRPRNVAPPVWTPYYAKPTHHSHGVPTSPALASSVKNILAIHACSTRPLLHHATLLLAQNYPVPFSTCPLTYGVMLMTPPHMASATACSSSTTIHTTCGCGSLSPKTTHALTWAPSCWKSNTCMHAITPIHARLHRSSSSTRTLSLRLLSPARCALDWASVCNFLPHVPITCSAKPNAPSAQSVAILLRYSTAWPSPIPCSRAVSAQLCTSATALTAA
jgi:hypothetical protein